MIDDLLMIHASRAAGKVTVAPARQPRKSDPPPLLRPLHSVSATIVSPRASAGGIAMSNVIGARAPGWFRLLSLLGLLWNAFGVYMYLKSVGMFGDPLAGLDAAHVALAQSRARLGDRGLRVAVFAGLLGSLCMVAGKRLATPLLLLSLLAVIVQCGWIILASNARAVEGAMALVMPGVITLVAILLVWLAGKGRSEGLARLGRNSPRARRSARQRCDIGIVLGERVGEDVAARAVGDEVERLGRRRIEHRGDRGAARIGDRARRQAGAG